MKTSDISTDTNIRPIDTSSADFADLVRSVKERGIIQPIIVDDLGCVVAGHRRLAAAIEAGLTDVPTVVRHTAGSARTLDQIVENVHRADLTPWELGEALREVKESEKLSLQKLAGATGLSKSHVGNLIAAATKIGPDIRQALETLTDDGHGVKPTMADLFAMSALPADEHEWAVDVLRSGRHVRDVLNEEQEQAEDSEGPDAPPGSEESIMAIRRREVKTVIAALTGAKKRDQALVRQVLEWATGASDYVDPIVVEALKAGEKQRRADEKARAAKAAEREAAKAEREAAKVAREAERAEKRNARLMKAHEAVDRAEKNAEKARIDGDLAKTETCLDRLEVAKEKLAKLLEQQQSQQA